MVCDFVFDYDLMMNLSGGFRIRNAYRLRYSGYFIAVPLPLNQSRATQKWFRMSHIAWFIYHHRRNQISYSMTSVSQAGPPRILINTWLEHNWLPTSRKLTITAMYAATPTISLLGNKRRSTINRHRISLKVLFGGARHEVAANVSLTTSLRMLPCISMKVLSYDIALGA